MLDRLKDILSSIRIRRINPTVKTESDGKIYALWLLVLPLLIGAVLGRLACVGLGYALDKFAGTGGISTQAVTGAREAEQADNVKRGLDGFLAANPFHISPQKTEEVPAAPQPVEEVKAPEPENTLDDVILRGTLPGVGAWVERDNKLDLLLINDHIDRYRLTKVTYSDATFRRGDNYITKYITYGPVVAKKKEEPKPAPATAPTTKPASNTGDVVAASPGAQEGQISSEMVNQLVQNPFDELKRIRLRPNDTAGGLEVQWIQNDSILKRLGVQRGDVVKSVNGIPFTNMGDIANSINSLMNSERFDVEVTRGGKPTNLRYVVR